MKKLCLLGIILGTFALQPALQACNLEEEGKSTHASKVRKSSAMSSSHSSPIKAKSESKQGDLVERQLEAYKRNESISVENERKLITCHNRALQSKLDSAEFSRRVSYFYSTVFGGMGGYFATLITGPYGLLIIPGAALVSSFTSRINHPTFGSAEEITLVNREKVSGGRNLFSEEEVDDTQQLPSLISPVGVKEKLTNDRNSITWQSALLSLIVGGGVFLGFSLNSK